MKPNWRNADDYKFTDGLQFVEWAWEFLRRNPKYRLDWNNAMTSLGTYGDGYPNLTRQNSQALRTLPQFDQASGAIFGLAYSWGLQRMANPDETYHVSKLAWSKKSLPVLALGRDWDNWNDPSYETISFDLTRSIMDQLNAAEIYLRNLQESRIEAKKIKLIPEKRDRTDNWKHYLRVLDAASEKVKRPEMARVLLPEKEDVYPDRRATDAIRKDIIAAGKLRDIDYIAVSLM